ncbi:hypothetical protein [Delftia sp.]|uniref:hypothetical protein n=1 Tax=Delftia sp. TaxID=1886637 RepID=UPI00259C9428|nr:hypothetical protein [Delftia sp.]
MATSYALARPGSIFFGTPIYHPWKLFEWWFFFDAYAPRVFDTGGAIAGGSGLLAVVVAIGYVGSGARANRGWLRPTARHAGRTRRTFARLASRSRPACSSASMTASTCGMKARNTS